MKRYLAIGAAVLVLLAAGWGLFWWHGRGQVEQALDAGVERLRQQGWTVTWEDREIGGFPFGYSVRLTRLTAQETAQAPGTETGTAIGTGTTTETTPETGAGGRLTLRLPWAVAETDGAGRIIIRMPESFAVDLPLPAIAPADPGAEPNAETDAETDAGPDAEPAPVDAADNADRPAQPAALATTGEADDLVLALSADGAVEVTADRLAWTVEQPEIGRTMTQTIEALEAGTTPESPGARYRVQAARVGAEAVVAEPDGAPSTAIASLRDVVVEGSSTVGSPEALAEMIYAGAPGQAGGSLRTGEAQVRLVSAGGTPGMLDWRAEAISGKATLTSGRMDLEGETRGNTWTLTSPDPSLPIQGRLSVSLARAAYAVPMAPSARADEMAIRLTLQEATADERVWTQVDPQGALPRDPASLTIDLTGTARVTERIDRLRPGAPPPFEISDLVFREVSASALGATLNASGEVDILQPVGVPFGEVQVALTGIRALVRALGRAGVLAPEMVTTAEAIMAVYLVPAEGEDAWTTEIGFTREGTLVNGLPVR